MSETISDILNCIKRRRRREEDYCLAVLDLWAAVQAQGIKIDTVRSFGFNEAALSRTQQVQRLSAQRWAGFDPFVETLSTGKRRPKVYNYVRHCDDSVTRLEPMLKAVYEHDT